MVSGAVANHRKLIRKEIARYSELFRTAQVEVVSTVMERDKIPRDMCDPTALVVLMTAIARIMSMEGASTSRSGIPRPSLSP